MPAAQHVEHVIVAHLVRDCEREGVVPAAGLSGGLARACSGPVRARRDDTKSAAAPVPP